MIDPRHSEPDWIGDEATDPSPAPLRGGSVSAPGSRSPHWIKALLRLDKKPNSGYIFHFAEILYIGILEAPRNFVVDSGPTCHRGTATISPPDVFWGHEIL